LRWFACIGIQLIISIAKDINKNSDEYPHFGLIDFINVLYVPNYQISVVGEIRQMEFYGKKVKG